MFSAVMFGPKVLSRTVLSSEASGRPPLYVTQLLSAEPM
jgi:hypothetical protein